MGTEKFWKVGNDEPEKEQPASKSVGSEKQPPLPSSETIQKQDQTLVESPAKEPMNARQLALEYVHDTIKSWENRPTLKQRKADELVRHRRVRVLTAQLDFELEKIRITKEKVSKKLKEDTVNTDKILDTRITRVRKRENKEKIAVINKRDKDQTKIERWHTKMQKLSNDWFDARISEVSQPHVLFDYASTALKKRGLADAASIEVNIRKDSLENAESRRTKIEVFEQKRAVNSKRIYDEADQKKKKRIEVTKEKIANIGTRIESIIASLKVQHDQTIKSAKDIATEQMTKLNAMENSYKNRFISENAKLADASKAAKPMSFLTEAALLTRFELAHRTTLKAWIAAVSITAVGIFGVYTRTPVDYISAPKTLIQQDSRGNLALSEFRVRQKKVDDKITAERKVLAEKEATLKAESDRIERIKKAAKAVEDRKMEIETKYADSIRNMGTWFLNAKIKEDSIPSVASVISSLNVLDGVYRERKIKLTDKQKLRFTDEINKLLRFNGEISASAVIPLNSMIEGVLNPAPKLNTKVAKAEVKVVTTVPVSSGTAVTTLQKTPVKIEKGPKIDTIITSVQAPNTVSKSTSTFAISTSSATLPSVKSTIEKSTSSVVNVENKTKPDNKPIKSEKKLKAESNQTGEIKDQSNLMIVGNIIYTYPNLRLTPKEEQIVYTFLTKKAAEAAYQKAKAKLNSSK